MPNITLNDHATDSHLVLSYAEVKKISVLTITTAQIERQDGTKTTYEFGIDGIRRLKDWMLRESAA